MQKLLRERTTGQTRGQETQEEEEKRPQAAGRAYIRTFPGRWFRFVSPSTDGTQRGVQGGLGGTRRNWVRAGNYKSRSHPDSCCSQDDTLTATITWLLAGDLWLKRTGPVPGLSPLRSVRYSRTRRGYFFFHLRGSSEV